MLNELKTIYNEYMKTAQEVRRKAPVFAGWLGLGSDPRKHPCHEEFYEEVNKWTERFLESQPSAESAREVALFMLETPPQYREHEAYWFMYVIIGNIRPLIPLLTKEACRELVQRFDALYKKSDRMPLQVETYKKLVKASK